MARKFRGYGKMIVAVRGCGKMIVAVRGCAWKDRKIEFNLGGMCLM